MLKCFADLEQIIRMKKEKMRVVVAAAHDLHTLQGIDEARAKGVMEPLLVGDELKIRTLIHEEGLALDGVEIVGADSDAAAAKAAVKCIVEGRGNVLMKGKLQTADLLREVVNKEYGLRTGEIMSHVGLFHIPSYHKLMMLTDSGMVIGPDAEQKRQILDNAVRTLHALGVAEPKVAVLCATEVENPKMAASVDAALLKAQNQAGRITGCIVEGPISFDLMYDKTSGEIKGFESPVCGDADIVLTPDMTSGNILGKSFMFAAKARMAGLIVGAKIPVVLVSRSATAEEKYWSLVFAAAVASASS